MLFWGEFLVLSGPSSIASRLTGNAVVACFCNKKSQAKNNGDVPLLSSGHLMYTSACECTFKMNLAPDKLSDRFLRMDPNTFF